MGGHISHCEIITTQSGTWWLNSKPSGIYTHMMKTIINQLEIMIDHHSKVHVIRFDLRQPTHTDSSVRITNFQRRFFRWLKREYGFKRIAFAWAREQEKAKAQHYHYALMLDGHKVQCASKILKASRDCWMTMDGSEWTPEHPYYNLSRHNDKATRDAIYRLSYLAKGRGKGYRPKRNKDYNASRLKPKISSIA